MNLEEEIEGRIERIEKDLEEYGKHYPEDGQGMDTSTYLGYLIALGYHYSKASGEDYVLKDKITEKGKRDLTEIFTDFFERVSRDKAKEMLKKKYRWAKDVKVEFLNYIAKKVEEGEI